MPSINDSVYAIFLFIAVIFSDSTSTRHLASCYVIQPISSSTTAVRSFVGFSPRVKSFYSFPAEMVQLPKTIYRYSPRHLRKLSSLRGILDLTTGSPNGKEILPALYMILLAVQFATQPILTKKFAPKGIIRSTYVLAQDCVRLSLSIFLLTITRSWSSASMNWSLCNSLAMAGVPSVLYLIQSYLSLIAYQTLSPITYNVLNQTKTISAAICCFLLLGQRQSFFQVCSLGILLLAALVMENVVPVQLPVLSPKNHVNENQKQQQDSGVLRSTVSSISTKAGIAPILAASLLSGLAGAWTQGSLRYPGRRNSNSLFFSLELSLYSILSMVVTLQIPGVLSDRELLKSSNSHERWFVGWTPNTLIPILVNAIGGILVGLVTKTSGVVPKGFALIFGMFLSGILQNKSVGESVTREQWIGGLLAAISIWIHASYPYIG
jgi:solute carrier family 35 (UDP-sugar transporter), member A1/2/3